MRLGGSAPAGGQRTRLVWAGGAAAGVALLQVVQSSIASFHLSPGVLGLLTAVIAVAGLGIGQWRQVQARREAARAADAMLDEALACWPPRPAATFAPDDVGVHPRLDVPRERAPYVPRDADAAMREALEQDAIVIVFGPPGAGKSRTAFQAVQDHAGEAILLMPEDAKGLRTLVAQTHAAVLGDEQQAVLWLEGLEHYLDGLDLDALGRFLRPRDDARIVLVATIRDEALDRLLKSPEREGLVTRRLLSRGRGVFVGDAFSDTELERYEERYGDRPDTAGVAAAFAQNWRAGWPRRTTASPDESRGRPRQIDMWSAVLGIGLTVLVVLLVVVGLTRGWTVAPPLEDQVRALADDIRPCQRLQAYPAAGAGLDKQRDPTAKVLVAVVSGADCLESDEVRFYRRGRDDRLKRIGSLHPAGTDARFSFACIGGDVDADDDPCHVTLRGNATSIVGAFRDDATQQEMPVIISFAPEGLRLRTLSLPKGGVPKVNRTPITLRLRSANGAVDAGDGDQCLPTRGCLTSRTAAAVAVVAPSGATPGVLLTGYDRGGIPQAPDAVRVRVWRIRSTDEEPERGEDCLVLVRGQPKRALIRNPSIAELRGALLSRWRPKGADVMC